MRLERKLTLAVMGLFIPPTVVAGLVLLLLYRRGLLEEPASLLTAVLIGLGAMVVYLIVVARGIGQSLVRTIEGLRRGAELIATVNPGHRLDVRTGDELEALGDEINRLADLLRVARDGLRADDCSVLETMERAEGPAERQHRLDALTFVVFDTETTGLRPEAGDRVVSLAGVRVRGGAVKRQETFDTLVDPGRAVPSESIRIHGISSEMLVGAPLLAAALPAFLEFAGPAVLVGHEIAFDLRFLEPEARRLGLPSLAESHAILDTRLLSRSLHGPGESHTLDAVAQRLGVPITGRHSALGDALITAEILVRLLTLVQKRGTLTLGQALDASQSARQLSL
jgi:DNA polymerase III epsilon subunit family exonuclease